MRKLVPASILAVALAAASTLYGQATSPNQESTQPQGQTQGQYGHGPRGQWGHHGPNPEFEAKHLAKHLNLTAEQTAQITPILAEQHERMKALMPARTPGATPDASAPKPDFKALHEQMKAIQTDTNAKLEAVLTPEQKTQFEAMHQHGNREHGPRGNWTPKTPAAPTE